MLWTPQRRTFAMFYVGFLDGCCVGLDIMALECVRQPLWQTQSLRVRQFALTVVVSLLLCYVFIPDARLWVAASVAAFCLAASLAYLVLYVVLIATGHMKWQECFRPDVGTCLVMILLVGVVGACFSLGALELFEDMTLDSASWPLPQIGSGDPTETMVLIMLWASLVPLLWQCCRCAATRAGKLPDSSAHRHERINVDV